MEIAGHRTTRIGLLKGRRTARGKAKKHASSMVQLRQRNLDEFDHKEEELSMTAVLSPPVHVWLLVWTFGHCQLVHLWYVKKT